MQKCSIIKPKSICKGNVRWILTYYWSRVNSNKSAERRGGMRVLICEDSKVDRIVLKKMLHQYFESASILYEILCYENGTALLEDVRKGIEFDVIFLELYMEGETGVEIAKEVRIMGCKEEIVFVTSMDEYVLENFEINVTACLRKEKKETVFRCLDEIRKRQEKKNYMIVKKSGIVKIPYTDILFVESNNTKCIFHLLDGVQYTTYEHLGKIELELEDRRFLRCHQSYLVNMDYVRQVEKNFELITGDIVCIKQHNLKTMKQLYYAYMEKR